MTSTQIDGQKEILIPVERKEAERQFSFFCEYMDFDLADIMDMMDKMQLRDDAGTLIDMELPFDCLKNYIIKMIMSGRLSVDEKGQATYILKRTQGIGNDGVLTFRRPRASDLVTETGLEKNIYERIASITGSSYKVLLRNLSGLDLTFCKRMVFFITIPYRLEQQ